MASMSKRARSAPKIRNVLSALLPQSKGNLAVAILMSQRCSSVARVRRDASHHQAATIIAKAPPSAAPLNMRRGLLARRGADVGSRLGKRVDHTAVCGLPVSCCATAWRLGSRAPANHISLNPRAEFRLARRGGPTNRLRSAHPVDPRLVAILRPIAPQLRPELGQLHGRGSLQLLDLVASLDGDGDFGLWIFIGVIDQLNSWKYS